jgi:lipoyl(octanoyl) transferase
MKRVYLHTLGLQPYKTVWDLQEQLFDSTVAAKLYNRDNPDKPKKEVKSHLVFCQHPHVYTLGNSGNMDNLLLDETGLEKANAEFHKVNRGGDMTYHGPGQLVGYPIFDLDVYFTDIHKFLRHIEPAIIDLLANYGLHGETIEGLTGVWLDKGVPGRERKICAIGVRCSRWVTMHGFALNVTTDLSYFNNIIACGIQDKGVTSLEKELGRQIDINEVQALLLEKLSARFEVEFEEELTQV